MPEKSGMDAPPSAGPAVAATICAEASIAAPAANTTTKRKSRRCTLTISSSVHDLPELIEQDNFSPKAERKHSRIVSDSAVLGFLLTSMFAPGGDDRYIRAAHAQGSASLIPEGHHQHAK
jgi:hypothetical protein